MRYAVKRLSDGLITNCIVLDPELAPTWFKPEDGLVLIEAETEGGLGDTHDDKLGFIKAIPPEPIPEPLTDAEALIEALIKKGIITKEDVEAEKGEASAESPDLIVEP